MKNLLGMLNLKELGKRLAYTDRHLFSTLGVRLGFGGLSDLVALVKQAEERKKTGSPVYAIKRPEIESQRLAMARHWAKAQQVDPNFADSILFSIIAESCRVQAERMENYKYAEAIYGDDAETAYEFQRQQLLELTQAVAPVYDETYSNQFFGTQLYLNFESEQIKHLVKGLADRSCLVDLGCATGQIAFNFANRFRHIIGIELSASMIERAQRKLQQNPALRSRLSFVQADLEMNIPLPDCSVSLAIMNFGTASDIRGIDRFLEEVHRILRKDGKFIFSFYNADSLIAAFDFLPWPAPVAAHIDKDRHSLEVHFGGRVYLLHARPYTVAELKILLPNFGLSMDQVWTHPVITGIVPQDLLSVEQFDSYGTPEEQGHCLTVNTKSQRNEHLMQLLSDIDQKLAHSHLHHGSYILLEGSRSK